MVFQDKLELAGEMKVLCLMLLVSKPSAGTVCQRWSNKDIAGKVQKCSGGA
jgi:hypothetical protein